MIERNEPLDLKRVKQRLKIEEDELMLTISVKRALIETMKQEGDPTDDRLKIEILTKEVEVKELSHDLQVLKDLIKLLD